MGILNMTGILVLPSLVLRHVTQIIVKKGSIDDVKYGTCQSLRENPDKVDKICARDLHVDDVGSAKATCPVSCRVCSGSSEDPPEKTSRRKMQSQNKKKRRKNRKKIGQQ